LTYVGENGIKGRKEIKMSDKRIIIDLENVDTKNPHFDIIWGELSTKIAHGHDKTIFHEKGSCGYSDLYDALNKIKNIAENFISEAE